MADGTARTRGQQFDTTLAYVDQMLCDAFFNSYYGELTFVFKAGKIVLVRKHETVIPTSSGTTDGGEAISEEFRDAAHVGHSSRNQR